MPSILNKQTTITAQTDRNKIFPVLAVILLIFVYMYCFTHLSNYLGLPTPQALSKSVGLTANHIFDTDHNVNSKIVVNYASKYNNDDERFVLFCVVLVAFLLFYYLPLKLKQYSILLTSSVGIALLYGLQVFCLLLACHLLVYLVLHPKQKHHLIIEYSMGVLFCLGLFSDFSISFLAWCLLFPFLVLNAFIVLYQWLKIPMAAKFIRFVVVHSAFVIIVVLLIVEQVANFSWKLPVGLILFMWLWARIFMYYIDYKDGLVPKDASLKQYLIVFYNPGLLPVWGWGATIAQGYDYVHNSYLSEDKNSTVIRGIKLLVFALLYLIFWSWVIHYLIEFVRSAWGIETYAARTRLMIDAYQQGQTITTGSVLLTTLLDLFKFLMILASVVHFKVGVWNLCGFKVAPYYNKPWLATNLMTFWTRFAYHYREFLVRAFYYPVFFNTFRKYPQLRIFVATMAAAAVGNMLWHMSEQVLFQGVHWRTIEYRFGIWAYYLFLAIGIASCQIYLLKRKKRRKPWSKNWRLVTDVMATYITLQYFALIHVFARPTTSSDFSDHWTLFLRGFGLG